MSLSGRPTVYVLQPGSRYPRTLASCESVAHAVTLAKTVRSLFGARAWVAAWARFAHVPSPTEVAIEAMYAREEARCA